MESLRTAGWAGIFGPVAFVATWAVAGAASVGYDPVGQAISELAAVGAPTRAWMSAAFVVFGLTALPFAGALQVVLPPGGRRVALAVSACGLGTIGAAVFPCTAGCPGAGASATDTGHAITATIGYLALVAAPLLTAGLLWPHRDAYRAFAWWSLLAGVVSAIAMAAWALGMFGGAGGAGQRGFNTLLDVWWATAGVLVLRRRHDVDPTDRTLVRGPSSG
jgi:hypothetical protein